MSGADKRQVGRNGWERDVRTAEKEKGQQRETLFRRAHEEKRLGQWGAEKKEVESRVSREQVVRGGPDSSFMQSEI